MQWYYSRQATQHGPIEESELHRLAQRGDLKPDDYVWNETLGTEWILASSVPGLFERLVENSTPSELPSRDGTMPNRELMANARASLKGNWALAVLATLIWFIILQFPNGLKITLYPEQFIPKKPVAEKVLGQGQALKPLHSPPSLTKSLISIVLSLITILITGPLTIGLKRLMLNIARHSSPSLADLFVGFRSGGRYYRRSIWVNLLLGLLIMGWTLLYLAPVIAIVAWTLIHPLNLKAPFWIATLILLCGAALVLVIVKAYSYFMALFIIADDSSVSAREAIRRSMRMMKGRKWKFFCLTWRFFGWMVLTMLTCGIGILWLNPYILTSTAHFYDGVKDRAALPA